MNPGDTALGSSVMMKVVRVSTPSTSNWGTDHFFSLPSHLFFLFISVDISKVVDRSGAVTPDLV